MEVDVKMCKRCGVLKQRIMSGKFDGKNKRYVDETGCVWNGHVCPSCHREKAKFGMRDVRFRKKNKECS